MTNSCGEPLVRIVRGRSDGPFDRCGFGTVRNPPGVVGGVGVGGQRARGLDPQRRHGQRVLNELPAVLQPPA